MGTSKPFSQASSKHMDTFSYVIVGAGSAGCVLANRLTEEAHSTVKLLEAGPKDTLLNSKRLLWKIHMPAALTYNLCDEKYNWYYHTTPQKHMDNRIMYWPRGQRWSTASAYLHPALSRPNLSAEDGTLVTKVLFEGTKAVGVEYVKNGEKKKVFASKEVILSGGAINSPQLLMLSGVGNSDDLKKLGIPVVCHLPGVGQNLQDHLELYVQQECTQPVTLYNSQKPLQMIKIGLEWLWKFTGSGATAHLETGGFIRSQPGVSHPDIQFHFLPSQVIDHGRVPSQREAYQVHIGPMRSTSIGWLKLKSTDPREHPILEPNYLSAERDMWEFRQCVKLAREIFAQEAFDKFRGPEIQPGRHVQTDGEIDAFVRQKADSAYHPSCTCKMGQSSDPNAVVDPQTRVIGTENLRVVDASVMPSIVSGNLNAPTIMIAEKAADIIKGLPSLQEKNVPVYKPKTLETQR
ncbi:Choline dehydrogenase, mitochondrial [Varanus komodoensis]|nr:Choline dehydrogenase, mitochondrial [Varanus komodoensis]